MEVAKITLKHPIPYGSETVTELTFRRPKAGDMRGIKINGNGDMSFDDMLTVAQRVTGKPPSVINEIDFEDLQPVFEVIGGFIKAGQQTGKTP